LLENVTVRACLVSGAFRARHLPETCSEAYFTMEWSGLFDVLVGMGDEEGGCPEQKLSVYNQVKVILLSVPEIAKHTKVVVSALPRSIDTTTRSR
jgi:hypothetical protein